MKKRILAIVLCLLMVLTTGNMAFAENNSLVGKTGTVMKGAYVYEEPDENSAKAQLSGFGTEDGTYQFTVVEEIKDANGQTWFKYDCKGLSLVTTYPYVKASDVDFGEVEPEEPVDPESGFDIPQIEYSSIANNGIAAKVIAPEGAFPEGTTLSITDDNVSVDTVKSIIKENIIGLVSVDIDFEGKEPSESVMVYMDIPADKIPEDANKVIIVHLGSNGPEIVGTKYINTSDEGELIAFSTSEFSSYAAVFVNGKYNAKLMSSVLENDSRYQIVTFPVDLFDYEPVKINEALNKATSDDNGFHFTGYNVAGCASNNGINNSTAGYAKQGIVANELADGIPVINHLNGEEAGETTGKLLFSDAVEVNGGKVIYNDIPFEFIYDSQTGYYEYKSSANHAQYNSDKKKIELYADTLSTQNSRLSTIDLSTAKGESDFISSTKSETSYKATAKDDTGNDRIDPYVEFPVENVAASNVGQIYVKAKIPANVGTNSFQLFFKTDKATSFSEEKSFGNPTYSKKIEYTANGDWIEFVVDTSENATYWKDNITGVRVDLFDSNKASNGKLDENGTYPIEISEISFIKKNVDAYETRGGFYPFSEIKNSYPGNNTGFDYAAWEQNFNDDKNTRVRASRSIYNPTPNPGTDLYEELAFGTVCEFDFYLPVDKKGLEDKPLTYFFDGDDDLWVFVDDKLVLDIGGGHGAITGNVNFTEGTWSVANAVTVTGYNSGAESTATGTAKNGTLPDGVDDPGKHTMKIFYLERGGSVSNCFMKFNLPRTPQGTVIVNKQAREANDANADVLMKTEFDFNIKVKNNGTGEQQEVALANTEYYIANPDGTSTTSTTDANGNFKLKSGQSAHFNINENYYVTVTEEKEVIEDHEWKSTTIGGNAAFSKSQLTVEGEEKRFDFVNIYERLYGDLRISKSGILPIDHDENETQSTVYTVKGNSENNKDVELEVCITGNDDRIIRHLPIGTYLVEEKTDWSWRYEPKTNNHTVNVIGGRIAETDFVNERIERYWLSGDSHKENWWGALNTLSELLTN